MKLRILTASTLAILALTGCLPRAPEPAPAPTPQVVARPAPPPPAPAAPVSQDWRDWPQAPGTWVYRKDGRGSIALFGQAEADAALTLRCDRSEGARLYLSVRGVTPGTATVRTTSTARTITLRPTGGSQPYAAVELAPGDRLLDAMGYSRGRFVIETAGSAPLVVPAWAEVLRVTEDCRQ